MAEGTPGPSIKSFRLVNWDNIKTMEDLKLVIEAMCGELGFSNENPYYTILEKKDLLGEMKDVAQDIPNTPTQ